MTKDDRFYLTRVALFGHAQRVGVSRACRDFGVHRSSYYRWRRQVLLYGFEILRPRERRLPRMPNQFPAWLEQKIVTFALANPGLGPRRLAAQLAQPNPLGELQVSASGLHKVLGRHGLGTRERRLAFIAGYTAPAEREPPPRPVALHLEADKPGDLVQVDCFHIGTLSGTKGKVWQYTAVDVASSFVWAQVHRTPRNPSAALATALVRRVAGELAASGWRLKAVSTDNGSEFRSLYFQDALHRLQVEQRFIRAGRPQTNGVVERAQRTILEECWRPTFARSLVPRYTALRRDLADYLGFYNYERAHTGRRSFGRTPAELVFGARKMNPK